MLPWKKEILSRIELGVLKRINGVHIMWDRYSKTKRKRVLESAYIELELDEDDR